MMNYHVFAFLLGLALRAVIAGAQADQSGYISIDCGVPDNYNYTDQVTNINYISDVGFINTGVSNSISHEYKINTLEQQFSNVRSFPEGTRNCYTLRPEKGNKAKYLIRASFMYGNYDGKDQLPKFDIHLGVEHWDTILFLNAETPIRKEILHIPTSDYINICLVKTGTATPFISTLELRTLNKTMYPTQVGSLKLHTRRTFNSLSEKLIRYKDDSYDRIWKPFAVANATTLSTTSTIKTGGTYNLPPAGMSTGATPTNSSDPLKFSWAVESEADKLYIYMHFAELQDLTANQTREFTIYINDDLWNSAFSPFYLSAFTIYMEAPWSFYTTYNVVINKTLNSTLPPLMNAVEVYKLKEFSVPETNDGDVAAMLSIKTTYELVKNWEGDPCSPKEFEWDGVTCIKDDFDPPRITSLNLSSNGLAGTIVSSISNLTLLQTLDLSNNKLTGLVPDFFAQMGSLKVLHLKGNNFTMPLPQKLEEKRKQGMIEISIDGTPDNPKDRKKKKSSKVVPIIASVGAVIFAIFALLIAYWVFRRKKLKENKKVGPQSNRNHGIVESREMQFSGKSYDTVESKSPNNNDNYIIVGTKSRQFTYNEVISMTNNFERVIGKGGFGIVYIGYVGTTQVAVKMLSQSSSQGYKEFQAEANLLLTIHHKNLTSLVGYCFEGIYMGIIYEYMANGNAEKHLLGKGPYVLNWEKRLRIAIDAGQGLEYLHHGCIPPIVHRDVKSTNILLDENFQAKLADFGLSRAFPIDDSTQISTMVAGTPGYLDPEYYSTTRLTEKSDIYSFGIVLLEIVTGRSALPRNNTEAHIITWISSELENGDIENIIDPKLRRDYSINSVWKIVELAMACVARNSARRPTMNSVVAELKASLAIEVSRSEIESKDSAGVIPMNLESRFGPQAR